MTHNPYAGRPQNPGPAPFAQPVPVAGPAPGQPYPQPAPPAGPYGAQPYPQQPGYPQQAYPQANYPQPGYGGQAYPQPAYPQPAYPQQPAYPAAPVQPAYPQPSPIANPAVRSVQPAARPVQAPSAPRPIPVTAQQAANPAARAGGGLARPVPVQPGSMPQQPQGKPGNQPAEQGEQELKKQDQQVARSAPPWLVSMIVHMLALIIMGLVIFSRSFDTPLTLTVSPPDIYAEEEGVQLLDDTLKMYTNDPVKVQEAVWTPDNLPPVPDPLATPDAMELVEDGTTAASDQPAAVIGLALSGRQAGMKRALLGAYGGTATTEAAVGRALEWLARQQRQDGSWSLSGPYSDGSPSENKTAATAMALLAFQGAGFTHKSGDAKRINFRKVVADGWKFLLGQQDADGNFFRDGPLHARLYSQAQATIAICELYGMEHDPAHKKPAQLAIDYAVKAQDPQEGGWRYEPRVDSDLSVTGWYMMALQSAQMAGLTVPSPTLESLNKYLDKVQDDGGRRYMYQPGRGATRAMSAEGLLCRQYTGWKRNDPRLLDGVKRLLVEKVDWSDQDVYYWYYATQVCHHMEGDEWDQWNAVMRQVIPENQVMTGNEKGSWNPNDDSWGSRGGGRLYMTCLCTYMLEVYYRHLPVYKHFTRAN